MRMRPFYLAAFVALLVAGCSGNDGHHDSASSCEGAPDPATAGPGDAEGWLPLASGSSWMYRRTGGPAIWPADLRMEIGAARSLRGFSAVEMRELDPATGAALSTGSALLSSTPAGVVELGAVDPANDPTPDIYLLRFPVTAGQAWRTGCSGLDYGQDLDGDGKNELLDVDVRGQLLGLEDVTVPAGTFAATAHVRLSITATLHPTNPAYQPATSSGWQDSWYARHVGVVRQTQGGQFPDQTYDLVGWSNPGGAGGLVALTRLIVPPPSSDPWVTPWRVVPLRGGAQRALVLQLAWGDGRPLRLEGRFADAGVATPPFEVVPEWQGDTLLPWRLVHQVAPGPDQHLVAFAVPGALSAMEVRAARVTAAGVARDGPAGLVVAQCQMSGTQAVAASRVGDGFLVAWSCDAPDQGVFAATIGADGAVGAPVKLGDGAVQFIQAAGDASAHLVVWGRGPTSTTEVVAVRVSAGGAPLDAVPVQVLPGDALYKFPGDLACGASECLLTWLEGAVPYGAQDLHAVRLVAGQPLEPGGLWLAGGAEAPLVVPAGDGYTLAWADVDAVRLARLGPALDLSPAGGLPLLPHYDFYDPLGPGALLSATATDAWVAYEWIESFGELRAARWVW